MVPDQSKASSAWSTSASRATSCGRWTTTSSSSSAKRELEQLGLADAGEGRARLRHARAEGLPDVRRRLRRARRRRSAAGSRAIGNLQQVGRNGLHRYNNSDHSMLTAIRAVENIIDGHEPRHVGGQRRVGLPRGARQEPEQPYKRASRARSAMREPLHASEEAAA